MRGAPHPLAALATSPRKRGEVEPAARAATTQHDFGCANYFRRPRLLRSLRRRRSAHRRTQACEIRQSEMQELGLLARGDRRAFARPEIERGERAQRLTADAARAARDHVDPFAARDIAGAGVELEQACFARSEEHTSELQSL